MCFLFTIYLFTILHYAILCNMIQHWPKLAGHQRFKGLPRGVYKPSAIVWSHPQNDQPCPRSQSPRHAAVSKHHSHMCSQILAYLLNSWFISKYEYDAKVKMLFVAFGIDTMWMTRDNNGLWFYMFLFYIYQLLCVASGSTDCDVT